MIRKCYMLKKFIKQMNCLTHDEHPPQKHIHKHTTYFSLPATPNPETILDVFIRKLYSCYHLYILLVTLFRTPICKWWMAYVLSTFVTNCYWFDCLLWCAMRREMRNKWTIERRPHSTQQTKQTKVCANKIQYYCSEIWFFEYFEWVFRFLLLCPTILGKVAMKLCCYKMKRYLFFLFCYLYYYLVFNFYYYYYKYCMIAFYFCQWFIFLLLFFLLSRFISIHFI